MTAIAGFVAWDFPDRPEIVCRSIVDKLTDLGGDAVNVRGVDNAGFGRALFRTLPEDDFNIQPLESRNGTLLFVADARIDNRGEIEAALGVVQRATRWSDAELLCSAWERWGTACADHLLGDYAFAAWDGRSRSLTLVRAPMATKPLFYACNARFCAFATLPMALTAIPGFEVRIDMEEAAAIAGGQALRGDSILFDGIHRLEPGHAVTIKNNSSHKSRIWEVRRHEAPTSLAEAGQALRMELDRAVGAQLRGRGSPIASQLSSGRDSSSVTATAARLLNASGERLIAITGAPRIGFNDGIDREWLSDESFVAAELAAQFDNVDHLIARPDGVAIASQFEAVHRHHFGPMLNAYSAAWSLTLMRALKASGVNVMLAGQSGNFSVSFGGFPMLVDVIRESGTHRWWNLSRAIHRGGQLPWRTVANLTFGPWLPNPIHQAALKASGRNEAEKFTLPYLKGDFRKQAEALGRSRFADQRPPRSYRDRVAEFLYTNDNGDQDAIALFGVELRDPTADRRLVELCHSFAPEQLLSASSPRPVYEAAFADYVTPAVIAGRRRGFQGADWFEAFDPEQLRAQVRIYSRHPIVGEIFDIDAMEQMLDRWPRSGGYEAHNIAIFGNRLLNNISLAGYIALHFPR